MTRCVAWLTVAALLGVSSAAALPQPERCRPLPPSIRVVDGDTFEADLDGNGRLEFPRERVRLLYVDTPELSESHKGQDLAHGLPAQAFLARTLKAGDLRLCRGSSAEFGKYGRTLGIVRSGRGKEAVNVNLALIGAGHSYFDTRFGFPRDYDAFAEAEGAAFSAQRGLWADYLSRTRYLQRLRQEGKTPRSTTNRAHYLPGPVPAHRLATADAMGRYVWLHGRLVTRRGLSNGHWKLWLSANADEGKLTKGLAVFVPERRAGQLGVEHWQEGQRLRLEGFVQRYRGELELVLHHGAPR